MRRQEGEDSYSYVRPEAAPEYNSRPLKICQRLGPRRYGGSRRILRVKLSDERRRDIKRVRGIHHRNLTTINNQVDATCLGECLKSFTDILLKRREDLLPPF